MKNYREKPFDGYLGEAPKKVTQKYMLIEDRLHEIHSVVVHKFLMGDVEDPILMAGEPLWKWQESEQGKWVMEHAVETPMWHRNVDHTTFGHAFAITAKLKAKDYSFFLLKWGPEGTHGK
jgi:hypothetical protein